MNRPYRNKILVCYACSSFDVNIKYNKRTIYASSFLGVLTFSVLCYAQFYEHDLFVKFAACNPAEFRESFYIDECAVRAPITDDPRYFSFVFVAICLLLLAMGLETAFVLRGATKRHRRFVSHVAYEWNFERERVHKLIEFLGIRERDIAKNVNLHARLNDHRLKSANGLLFANLYLALIFRNRKEFLSLSLAVLALTVVPPTALFDDALVKIFGVLCFAMGNVWPIQAFFLLSFLSLQDSNWIILPIYLALILLKIPIFMLIDRFLLGTSRLQLYRTLVANLSEVKSKELIKCLEGIPPTRPTKKDANVERDARN